MGIIGFVAIPCSLRRLSIEHNIFQMSFNALHYPNKIKSRLHTFIFIVQLSWLLYIDLGHFKKLMKFLWIWKLGPFIQFIHSSKKKKCPHATEFKFKEKKEKKFTNIFVLSENEWHLNKHGGCCYFKIAAATLYASVQGNTRAKKREWVGRGVGGGACGGLLG